MPHTNCTAFKRDGQPCNARLTRDKQQDGLCGKHNYHLLHNIPELTTRFNREQEAYRVRWERQNAQPPAPVVDAAPERIARPPPAPVAPPPPPTICGHMMTTGRTCPRNSAGHEDGKCHMHHNMVVRQGNQQAIRLFTQRARTMLQQGVGTRLIDQQVAIWTAGVPLEWRNEMIRRVDWVLLEPYNRHVTTMIHVMGATVEQLDAQIEQWTVAGDITPRRAQILREDTDAMFRAFQWRAEFEAGRARPRAPRFGPEQREAQLAADSQNVHTREITQQMRDSLAMLTAVDVPETQNNTVNEIRLCWVAQGHSAAMIGTVYNDVVDWWNRKTIFTTNDKLFKKCLRGLWWTIKQYKGDVRKELEKRLWEECKEAALPYSVCVQGHMARLSNVMVGFDEAFAPPVPVGEILQNRMSSIASMDITSDEQVKLAAALLKELNIPTDQHDNWLAAF